MVLFLCKPSVSSATRSALGGAGEARGEIGDRSSLLSNGVATGDGERECEGAPLLTNHEDEGEGEGEGAGDGATRSSVSGAHTHAIHIGDRPSQPY